MKGGRERGEGGEEGEGWEGDMGRWEGRGRVRREGGPESCKSTLSSED